MNFFSLIKKNREYDEAAFQQARRQLIEKSINNPTAYPTVGSETAILRKQIYSILQSLKENGINAETKEFQEYNQFVELKKEKIDEELDN